MTLSDLEKFSEIFNDTKHRAVSLRQLSFLLLASTVLNGQIYHGGIILAPLQQ